MGLLDSYGIEQIRQAAKTAYRHFYSGGDPDYITRKTRLFIGRCLRETGGAADCISEDVAASVAWSAFDDVCEDIFWAYLKRSAA